MFNRTLWGAESTDLQSLIDQYEAGIHTNPVLRNAGLLRPLTITPLDWKTLREQGVCVSVLRADLLHPVVSGNKWFKLKYNLLAAINDQKKSLLSFGGAWSNHLHALAYTGRLLDLQTSAVIRGDELTAESNVLLSDLHQQGMRLQFVSRSRYRELCRTGNIPDLNPDQIVIPEGGDNALGVLGAATMLDPQALKALGISHILTALGTGCTFAGLCLSAPSDVRLIGISALKGNWIHAQMEQRLQSYRQWLPPLDDQNWQLYDGYHRGGFGRTDDYLLSFIQQFADNTGLQLDPIYTGKAILALKDLVEQRVIAPGSHVLFVHSGGLQGNRGFVNFTK